MEGIDSFWTFQESVDELKQRLQYTTYELELTRKETSEEIRKNNDHIKKLLQLLQTTCKERDEAQSQLKKLQQIMSFNHKSNNNLGIDQFNHPTAITAASPDSPLFPSHFPAKTNSSALTDSSSLSLETQNNNFNINNNNNNNNSSNHLQSHVSSPDSCNIVFSTSTSTTTTTPPIDVKPNTKEIDQESLVIANLAKGRPLPQKGKLLQAVIESGPLLSTLMVAGSLPQWRNPPGLLTHQIPPVDLKGCGGVVINQSPGCNKFYTSQPSNIPPQSFNDVGVINHHNNNNASTSGNNAFYNGSVTSSGPIGVCPSSLLDFGGGSSGSCFMGGRMMMNSSLGFDCQIPKRQRIL